MRRLFLLFAYASLGVLLGVSLGACSVTDIVGDPDVPQSGVLNPDAVKTPEGALAFYFGAVSMQGGVTAQFAKESGVLTDELRPLFLQGTVNDAHDLVDARTIPGELPEGVFSFAQLADVRANARQGRGVLAEFDPTAPEALTGHLYAVEAFADVMLADLYCSGIPLSTVNYDGTYTLRSGSTTTEVYDAAIVLFDSALTLSGDSARISNFAAVGKGRALLALGKYDEAAAAVNGVPTSYVYAIPGVAIFPQTTQGNGGYGEQYAVSDREGGRGLPYATSGDPRSAVDTTPHTFDFIFPPYVARKYAPNGLSSIVLASGIEARLIEAEANLRAGGTAWLELLNTVRADSSLPAMRDTALAPLSPGKTALAARLDQILAERGYWLFLTGHRQGDLRRFIRNDNRAQVSLYPSGPYPGGGSFGSTVVLPVPFAERAQNSKYSGCYNREA